MHHQSHPDIVNRLKRAGGHLNKIVEMIEADRPCLEVAQQMQAVYSAIGKAKTIFVHDHIEGCLGANTKVNPARLKALLHEMKEISKYL